MLHLMRQSTNSIILKVLLFGLLVMAMLGFVFMDVNSILSSALSRQNIVTYKGGKITMPEFNYKLGDALRQQNLSEADAYRFGLVQQLLQGEIDKVIITKAARDAGLVISDIHAASQINGIIAPLLEQGASKKEALDFVLRQSGTNEAGFLQMIKQHLSKQMLSAVVLSSAKPNEQLIHDIAIHDNEQRKGKYISLNFSDVAKVKKPTKEELKDYYSEVAYNYQTPEYRDFSVLVINKETLGINVSLADSQVKQAYEDNIEKFITPDSRDIAQALAKDESTATKIYEEVKAGKSLKEIAEIHQVKFIESMNFTKDALPKELSDASFSADKAGVLEPIQSPLGWHILKLEKITKGKTTSYKDAKKELKAQLEQESVLESLYEVANQIDDAVASGASLEEISKDNNIKTISFKQLTADTEETKKNVPIFKEVVTTAFELQEGEASNLLETANGDFVLVEVSSVTPAHAKPLADIKQQLETQWVKQKQLRLLSEKAADTLGTVTDVASLKKVAKTLGKKVKSTGFVGRYPAKDKKSDSVSIPMRRSLFSLTSNFPSSTVNGGSETIHILVLEETKLPAYKDISKEKKDSIKNALAREYQEDVFSEYRERLLDKYRVKINYKLLERMYDDAMTRAEEG